MKLECFYTIKYWLGWVCGWLHTYWAGVVGFYMLGGRLAVKTHIGRYLVKWKTNNYAESAWWLYVAKTVTFIPRLFKI